MEGQDCPDCKIAAKKAATAARAEEIRAKALDADWPKLAGTEKQIDWATTDRFRLLSSAIDYMIRAEAAAEPGLEALTAAESVERAAKLHELGLGLDYLRRQVQGGWWIDNRNGDARFLLESALESMKRDEAAAQAEAKARAQEGRLRALAQEARGLFGSDEPKFEVRVWHRDGEVRVYIGGGYQANWVEYWHTGNSRANPGTLKVIAAVVKPLAKYLGVSEAEARERIRQYCERLCGEWRSLTLEVSPENAPLDPAAVEVRYRLRRSDQWATRGGPANSSPITTADKGLALGWLDHEEARAAIPQFFSGGGEVEVVPTQLRVPFPPRAEVLQGGGESPNSPAPAGAGNSPQGLS